ncbi:MULTISPECIES: peptidase inhibitor family I36 protein [Streptomyces]|uniref:peptidase inhibitor family I36 protein n=1 Tax=Streptomyces TaxID=1883 RepID=UPI0020707772|nr:peptidase inhibitor family I36 protein [Streptomyces sp. WAC00303]UPT41678.1 peptidase inhibitor family I36 protein [Streptomyces sp. WAC00303]WTF64519.1 peptidase inhibitor family I36 protein [Streptomyces anulatus]
MRTTVLAAAALAVTALVPQALVHDRAAAAPERAPGVGLGTCEAGSLCLWKKPDFTGTRHAYELSGVDIESCTPLPKGGDAQSLANRTGRPVTTYQSAECAETGEFETYPGGGTWTPRSPYQVRAFKIWEN